VSTITDIHELAHHVEVATQVYRKGEVITIAKEGDLTVVTVDAFPTKPELAKTVDVHFVTVGFTEEAAALSHREFYDVLLACREGVFANMELSDWVGGPSYIAIGGWIGDQTLALAFMALGELHKLWHVITPATLHITDHLEADRLAGAGYVMTSGLREPAVSEAGA
jgi:hypothetical protein